YHVDIGRGIQEIPIVVAIGNQFYGLSDSPISCKIDPQNSRKAILDFTVPTDAVRQYRRFTVLPLLFNKTFAKPYEPNIDYDFVISSVKTLLTDKDSYHFALIGSGLGGDPLKIMVNGQPGEREPDLGGLQSTANLLIFKVKRSDFDIAETMVISRPKAYP